MITARPGEIKPVRERSISLKKITNSECRRPRERRFPDIGGAQGSLPPPDVPPSLSAAIFRSLSAHYRQTNPYRRVHCMRLACRATGPPFSSPT